MKRKYLFAVSVLIAIALTACGSASTPSLSVTDVQNTAVALAWTGIAMTQSALPTATLLPPTSTPLPLPTFAPLPSAIPGASTFAPGDLTGNATATVDPCERPVDFKPQGVMVEVRLVNRSGGSVNLALGMNQPNGLGECGIYSFSISTYGTPEVKIMAGCYWGYAWVSGKKPSTAQTTSPLCFTDPNNVVEVTIGSEVIGID